MTRIFEALKKAQSRTGGLPFPPAEPAPVRPLLVPRSAAPSEQLLSPQISIVPTVALSDEVLREMTGLRIGLESALEGRRTRVVMFLGSISGEGATTVASQFASLLANDGRGRTLILDVNMRRPAIAARLGVSAAPAGSSSAAAAPVPIGRGAHPLSVALLTDDLRLAGARGPTAVRGFLAAVSSQFEWVIVDGPPVLETAESIDLAPIVDGVVMVVRSGHTKRPVVLRAVELLRKSGVRILGSVLTRRRLEIPDFIYRRI